ncbi:MAG: hypothetical protein KF760_22945 [Candidatus Eremiobacteraeota bacterium]|nr:hypothetical protein [Candidatus Eremiobacteraeota bacterium]MCW5868369.1 hypothetical protein [Candidatus Eremiobacteraeota bacterium]
MSRSLCSRIATGGLLFLACALPGWAQLEPEWAAQRLPASTQIYLEYQPRLVLNSEGPPLAERLRRSPLFRVVLNQIRSNAGEGSQVEEMMKSFPFWDGRFMLAVARQGELSPFESMFRAQEAARHRRQLRYAVDQAFEGVNLYRRYQKKFPKSVDDLIAKEHLSSNDIPEGALLELKREGKNIRVVGRWQVDGRTLEMHAPGASPVEEPLPDQTGGFVAAVGCPESARFNNWMSRWDAESEELSADGDHWKMRVDGNDYLIYFQQGRVWVSNQTWLVAPLLAAAPPAENLTANPRFAEQFRRLRTDDTEMWVFADVQDVLRSSPQLCVKAGWSGEQILLRSIGIASGGSLDAGGQLELQTRGFVQWDGVQNVTLGPPAAAELARRVPPASETMYWFDVAGWIRLLDRVGGEFSGSRELIAKGWTELEKRLGFSLARESVVAGTQLYVYGEAIDTYASTLEQFIQLVQGFMGSGPPDVSDVLEFSPSKVPVVAVLEVANADLAGRIQARLKERLGAGASNRKVEGVTYTVSQDGRCGWTSSNTTQFWANGYTERLLPRIFKAYQGGGRSLAEVPSYQLFQQDRQGEQVFYAHHMVDREYAFVKGLLLLLGSDFRPEAEVLGHLRDAHVRLEVVPGGIRLRAGVYSESAQGPPPSRPAEEE